MKAWFARQAERPLLRPIAAVVRPVWRAAAPRVRFLFDRITPGGLGLELTTAIAVAAVGIYVFVLYAVIFSGDLSLTPFDRAFEHLARRLYDPAGVDIAKVVSAFGTFTAAYLLVLVTAVLLASRGHFYELVALPTTSPTPRSSSARGRLVPRRPR